MDRLLITDTPQTSPQIEPHAFCNYHSWLLSMTLHSKPGAVIITPLTRWQCCLATGLFRDPERVMGRQGFSPPPSSYHETTVNAAGQVVAVDAIYWLPGAASKVTTLTGACTAFTPAYFCSRRRCCRSPSPLDGVGRVGWKTALETSSWKWFLLLVLL